MESSHSQRLHIARVPKNELGRDMFFLILSEPRSAIASAWPAVVLAPYMRVRNII